MIPPVLGAIFYGKPAFDFLIIVSFVVLAYEWIKLCGLKPLSFDAFVFYAAGLSIITFASYFNVLWSFYGLIVGCCLLFLLNFRKIENSILKARSDTRHFLKIPWMSFGFCYFSIAVLTLVIIRQEGDVGRNIILFLFLISWAADSGAYAFGKIIGGPKLAPVLSPNKTWAGFVGGVFCAALVGAGFALFIKESGVLILTVSAAILGIISQCGDLLESRIKRLFQVKDLGSLIPGHGGLLDRTDSLLAMSWATGLLYWLARDEVLKWM